MSKTRPELFPDEFRNNPPAKGSVSAMLFPNRSRYSLRSAFTVVEALIVVAVIGVLVGIVVFTLPGTREDALRAVRQRNAQEIVSLSVAARTAGAVFIEPGDKATSVSRLIDGATSHTGTFKDVTFSLSNIDKSVLMESLPYIGLKGHELVYDGSGGQ
jgi:type II secretory pathway pseudopilin PulG